METNDTRSLSEIYGEELRFGEHPEFMALKDFILDLPGRPLKPCACRYHSWERLQRINEMLSKPNNQE